MSGEVAAVIALALGQELPEGPVSWPRALAIAEQERCAALAWLRSSAHIRRMAPAEVVNGWRAAAVAAVGVADLWEAVIARVVETLRAKGVDPILLKGLPLAQRLYGALAARPCADLDLFVPCEQRTAAHRALLKGGWRWRNGLAPREGGYEAVHGGRSVLLEVHSSLLDDGIVSHLGFNTPRARVVRLGQLNALAHDDDQLPAFLAAHLAKHAMPPLLWLVDFDELWRQLDARERDRARSAARAARAHRYLEWAVQRCELLRLAGNGSAQACVALGFGDGRRADGHPALRVASLAARPRDALRVFAAWAVPRGLRGGRRELLTRFVQRLRKPLRRALGTSSVYAEPAMPAVAYGAPEECAERGINLDGPDLAAVARDLGEKGLSFWIRATGSSMQPAIPDGALIRLAPMRNRGYRKGDVVLADLGDGACVVHRIRRFDGGLVYLQGDANLRADSPVAADDILAIADACRIRGAVEPIRPARIARAWSAARAWRLRLSRRGDGDGARSAPRPRGVLHAR